MNTKILGSVAVALLAGPISANAQSTTYTYQGAALPAFLYLDPPQGGTFSPPPSVADATLSGFVTLSAPLGDNLNDFSVAPTQLQMVSGVFGPVSLGTLAFSTNGKGAIDGWSMSLTGFVGGPGGWTETVTSSGVGGDNANIASTCTAFFSMGGPQNFSCGWSGSNMKPGAWTSPASAPEIDPASAASGLALLLGGVAVLRGRRRLEP